MKFAARKRNVMFGAAIVSLVSTILVMGQNIESSKQKWLLTTIDGKPVSESKAFIEIDNEKGRFTGHTGCNRMFGGIAVSETLKFGAVGTTRMFCGDDENRVESSFLSELSKVTAIRESGSTLEMLDGNRVALSFKSSTAVSTIKIDDKKWVLESINGVDVIPSKEVPFVNFDTAKGQLGGNSGCNSFGGSFTATGSKFDASKMLSTMMACEEGGRMSIEHRFLDGLDKADNYEIKNGKLSFFTEKELVLTLHGEKK